MNSLVLLRAARTPASFTVNRRAHKIFIHRDAFALNPSDRNALEAALQLGGPVTAAAVGGAPADDALRQALAVGAARALCVNDSALVEGDAGALTRIFQRVAERAGGVELIVLGADSLADDSGPLGARLAAALGWPLIEDAHRIEVNGADVDAVVAAGPRFERRRCSRPAVVTVARDSNKPRLAPGARIINVYSTPEAVEKICPGDLGLKADDLAPSAERRGEAYPPEREPGTQLEGAPQQLARQLAALLTRQLAPLEGAEIPLPDRAPAPAVDALSAESFSDIWVAVPDSAAAPLLGEARRLADTLGCYVHAVVTDPGLAEMAITCGADRVHPVAAAQWGAFWAAQRPEFAFFPVSLNGFAAWLAETLRAGLLTDARALAVDDATRALRGAHPVYGGDYLLDLALPTFAKIATLDARHLPEAYADPSRSGEIVEAPAPGEAAAPTVQNLGRADYARQTWRPLSKARFIVSVGRGVKDEATVALARQLAARFGGELAGDQSARDAGWIDEAHQVGVTAQEVAPDIYLALGIRGDTIHNAALAGARQIIAVYPRAEASIFTAADAGVVLDPRSFLPLLLAQLA
jgi:electron transfer flavoprotein alpha subunit